MQIRILAALACGCVVTGSALADTVVVNDQVQVRESQLDRPKRGSTRGDVEKRFGAPVNRHPTVGAPPITRWHYNGFSVVFARDRAMHAGARGGMAPAAGWDTPASASDVAPAAAPAPQ